MNEYIRVSGRSLSWHVVREWTRKPGVALTLCGRRATGATAADFGDDKTCELCYRAKAREVPA